ncbi:5464_t:CDS:1, partial [Funneliformis mosseae]
VRADFTYSGERERGTSDRPFNSSRQHKSLNKEAFTVDKSMIKEYERLEAKASELLSLSRPLQSNN